MFIFGWWKEWKINWTFCLERFETATCVRYLIVIQKFFKPNIFLQILFRKCCACYDAVQAGNTGLPLYWRLCSSRYIPVLHSTGWKPWASSLLKTLQLQVYSSTPQHKLGTLGFLSTEDSAAPGIFLYSTAQAGTPGLPLYWRLCSSRYIPVLHSTGWELLASSLLKTLQL